MSRRRAAIAALLATLAAAPSAGADDDARDAARRHFTRGVELVDEGAFDQAALEFQHAYDLQPHFAVLYNAGQALAAARKPVDAVRMLQRYLDEGGANVSPARRGEVVAEIGRQRARIAELTIVVAEEGATVRVDGRDVGKAPLPAPVQVAAGEHVVSATREGFTTGEATVAVTGEEKKLVTLTLEPIVTPVTPVTPATVLSAPPAVEIGDHDAWRDREEAARRTRLAAYLAGGAGIVAGAASIVVFAWNDGRYHDWKRTQGSLDQEWRASGVPTSADLASRQQANDDRILSVHTWDAVTVVLAISGVALAATGTVLYFAGKNSGRRPSPSFSPERVGLRGEF